MSATKDARIAELEANIAEYNDAHDYWQSRTERAEAECKALREALDELQLAEKAYRSARESMNGRVHQCSLQLNTASCKARAALNPSPTAECQRDDLERHRYVDRGEPLVMPKDGFINDYD